MNSFEGLKISEPVARAITELGCAVPTAIQQQALPIYGGASYAAQLEGLKAAPREAARPAWR